MTRKYECLILAFVVVACWPALAESAEDNPKATVGKLVVVMPPNANGLNYFPDEQISVIGKSPSRLLVVSGNATVLLQGPSLADRKSTRLNYSHT